MAAVQRTPTPIDPRSRTAFIESMEEELKRVQEHLGRRQWRQRNGPFATAATITTASTNNRQQHHYHTLARSNPATGRRRRLWDQRDRDHEGEDSDETFCRVNSAQDTVERRGDSGRRRRTSTPTSNVSSCSSKSPASSPEPIRVKSPQRLPSAHFSGSREQSSFSSPTRALSPREYPFSPPLRGNDSETVPYRDPPPVEEVPPLAVKEMAYAFRDAVFPDESYDAEVDEEEEEEVSEEETETREEEHREVMPSALDDLFAPSSIMEKENGIKTNERSEIIFGTGNELEVKSLNINNTGGLTKNTPTQKRSPLNDHRITTRRRETTPPRLSYNQAQPIDQQLRRVKELKTEKLQSDRQLTLMIEQLQLQLREKEKDIESLQTQQLMELNVREERIKKLTRQNARLEREKWDLLKRAREAAERSVNLRTKLDLQDGSMRSYQVEMDRMTDEMSAIKAANNSLRALIKDLRAKKQTRDAAIQVDEPPLRHHSVTMGTPPDLHREEAGESDSGHASGGNGPELTVSEEWGESISITSSQFDNREATPTNSFMERQGRERRSVKNLLKFKFRRSASTGKQRSTSSLTRVNASSLDNLQLSQSSLSATVPTTSSHLRSHHSASGLIRTYSPNPQSQSSVSLQQEAMVASTDPRQVLREFQGIPFPQWNTRALVAWMEIAVGMPQYISTVRQHVTSGYAMLALTNSDMEKRLGISHPLHRRRLHLSIEELRRTSSCPHWPEATNIDHNWVAYTWAVDCGLPQLSSLLYNGMVNGLVLNSLSREDLKKYFKLSKKVEQLSFLSGVELLRMHDFKHELILTHRQTTNNPLYWTNKDICEWLKKIDLEEYSNHVMGSGVHGALLFLERGYFNSEQLSNIMHLSSKSPIRKYLAKHLAKLFSTDEINSVTDDDFSPDSQLTPELPPLSPSSPPPGSITPLSDHSPHPSRRLLLTPASSNPNLSEELSSAAGGGSSGATSNFDRNHSGRRSLRESMLRRIQLPQEPSRQTPPRPVSQLVSTTTV